MNGESLSRVELLQLLGDMDSATGEWLSVYLRPESVRPRSERPVLQSQVDERLIAVASLLDDEEVQRQVERYGTGLVVFQSMDATHAVVPPFPVLRDTACVGRPETEPLRELMGQPRRIVFVLVTWGAYVAGLYEGLRYVRHKQGTGHIHPHTKKGGSSQARYQRRTQGQRAEFLRRAGAHIDEEFGTEAVDHLFFGGNRVILKPLADECQFVRRHMPVLSPRTLLVKRATLASLDGALGQAYSSVRFRK
ncbi:MAG: hypothetical protein M0R22_11075 [Dehalococcoidia bacterium]|jgi:hypothetical protein|nr:hypothetical protein [Dehalococcoidia bacterium]